MAGAGVDETPVSVAHVRASTLVDTRTCTPIFYAVLQLSKGYKCLDHAVEGFASSLATPRSQQDTEDNHAEAKK